jgi:hypothetical protein
MMIGQTTDKESGRIRWCVVAARLQLLALTGATP